MDRFILIIWLGLCFASAYIYSQKPTVQVVEKEVMTICLPTIIENSDNYFAAWFDCETNSMEVDQITGAIENWLNEALWATGTTHATGAIEVKENFKS